MKSGYYRSISLKARMALAVTSLFVVFVVAVSFFTLSRFERSFRQSIYDQQFSLVSGVADSIDDKLKSAHNTLIALASTIPPGALANADDAQRFLDSIRGFHSIFDNYIALISPEGKLIADSPYMSNRRGKDLSHRDFVKKTVDSGKPQISEPYVSTRLAMRPAVMMTVPIFDRRGKVSGLLGGSIDLLGKNFLADLSKITIGTSGYLCLSDSKRNLIVYPDRSRIMKPGAPPGANRLYDRAVNGFEGSGENFSPQGVPLISSYKRLRTNSWILGGNYPTSEAYAPLYQAKRFFLISAVAATAVLLIVTLLITRRLLTPLAVITRHVKLLSENPEQERHLAVDSVDEVGMLATAFNTMMDNLDRQQGFLRAQKKKIEDERAFLQTLIDAIPDLIFYKDRDSVYLGCNDSFAALFAKGQPKYKVVGRSDHDLDMTAAQAEFFRQRDREVLAAEGPCRYEMWVALQDGRQILEETLKVPFRDALGNVKGVIGISRDVTERRLMEDELRILNTELERRVAQRTADLQRLNRELESFCYSISHELRAPIARLMGFSRMLAEAVAAGTATEARREGICYMAERIGVASLRLRSVIDSLLLMNRLSRAEIRIEQVNLSELAEKIVAELLAEANGRVVKVRIPPDIVVHRDRSMLEICMRHLLGNALKFTSKKAEAEIEFGRTVLSGESVFFVRDNGAGFDVSFAEKLFEPFSRLHGEDEFEGSGMGLPTVQMIVERHGGRIWAESEVGKGATFYFT